MALPSTPFEFWCQWLQSSAEATHKLTTAWSEATRTALAMSSFAGAQSPLGFGSGAFNLPWPAFVPAMMSQSPSPFGQVPWANSLFALWQHAPMAGFGSMPTADPWGMMGLMMAFSSNPWAGFAAAAAPRPSSPVEILVSLNPWLSGGQFGRAPSWPSWR